MGGRFFCGSLGLATPAPRTLFQDQYNAQIHNVLDVGANHFIDAPSVEKWLIDNALPGVDTIATRSSSSTGGDVRISSSTSTRSLASRIPIRAMTSASNRQTRKIIAWGGTTADDEETGLGARGERRVWFHDLSAGPEAWTDNWNVDDADVDGDGVADYRLPPIWEYLTAGGYRAAAAVTADLARVTRFVGHQPALHLVTAVSAVSVAPAAAGIDQSGHQHLRGLEGVDASQTYQKPALLVDELTELHRVPYTSDQQDLAFKQGARNCYQLWLNDNACYPNRPYPAFANLFLYSAFTLNQTRDGGGDYEGMLLNYVTEDNRDAGLLGFADDNWVDGTQSGVFSFLSPAITALGYGLTTTQIHEFGHHIGMSHPHDGWDSEMEMDYGPEGDFYFAWAGDESNSMMSYVDLNWDFSQFDRDNFNRFHGGRLHRQRQCDRRGCPREPECEPRARGARRAPTSRSDWQRAACSSTIMRPCSTMPVWRIFTRGGRRLLASVNVPASDNGWVVLPALRGQVAGRKDLQHVDRYGPGTKRSDQ